MWLIIRTSDGKVRHQEQLHADDPVEALRRAIENHRHEGCELTPVTPTHWRCITTIGVETTIALEPDAPTLPNR